MVSKERSTCWINKGMKGLIHKLEMQQEELGDIPGKASKEL